MEKKKAQAKTSKYSTSDGHSYLTKRIIVSKAKAAGKKAAANAMKVMGFVIVAENDTIVKKYPDGSTELIATI